MQNTNHVLMIRPVHFTYNFETAVNNSFQLAGNATEAQQHALKEFDALVEKLRENNIDVTVVDDTPEPHTPDSIFPNNWISFHENKTVVLYPMFAENRRAERKQHVLEVINKKFGIFKTVDLTKYETQNIYLEGTGSMVLDRTNKIAYACISPRTNIQVLKDFCERLNYTACFFTAVDTNGSEIYHTNVMMCVADKYVVICVDSIKNEKEREDVAQTILQTEKEIVSLTLNQMNSFAGNMLQLKNKNDEKILVMSAKAFHSLTSDQITKLKSYNRIIHSDLTSIETNGGGSARCMIAEIFS